jgi:hypothetical protein
VRHRRCSLRGAGRRGPLHKITIPRRTMIPGEVDQHGKNGGKKAPPPTPPPNFRAPYPAQPSWNQSLDNETLARKRRKNPPKTRLFRRKTALFEPKTSQNRGCLTQNFGVKFGATHRAGHAARQPSRPTSRAAQGQKAFSFFATIARGSASRSSLTETQFSIERPALWSLPYRSDRDHSTVPLRGADTSVRMPVCELT